MMVMSGERQKLGGATFYHFGGLGPRGAGKTLVLSALIIFFSSKFFCPKVGVRVMREGGLYTSKYSK